jgi:acetolactate synthase-1/2/3 large subunit
MIRWKQTAVGFPDWGLEFGNPDFVAYAQSYGAQGHRVESTQSFATLLKSCFTAGGIHLVEVPVDYSENKRVLIDELAEKICLI